MKSAIALGVLSAIILILAFWIIWPSTPVEPGKPAVRFTQKLVPPSAQIDPPFGFHWGDSMARVEALLGYSSAEIVTRMATGDAETWVVEGLIQPGLKSARFVFEKNTLTMVELACQYDAWNRDRYRTRIEELRAFFDSRYGEKQHGEPISTNDDKRGINRFGYLWRLGDSQAAIVCGIYTAPGKRQSVSDLTIQYQASVKSDNPVSSPSTTERWSDTIVSPAVAKKMQPEGDNLPEGSDLGITSANLLNVSDGTQTAFSLRLAVKLQEDALLNPTKAVVEVNFYDIVAKGEIILTDAEVNYDWRSQRDWKEANPENLTVNYIRKGGDPVAANSARKYFGYVATVYNDGRLESVRAEPAVLMNLFPIRTYLSPFERAQNATARGEYTTAVSLYRRAADQGNLFALENLAWFYAHGKGVEKNYRQAAVFYERASLQNTPRALNALAWLLATCEDNSVRNGAEAVRQATKACELSYWQEWKFIDTLAAAWADTGDFKRAIECEQKALDLKDLDEQTRKKCEDRLALYQKRQPVRE